MKFLVDGMLGGLARWLRMLGVTADYDASSEDNNVLRKAKEEDLIILTADRELSRRAIGKNIPCLLVRGLSEPERLAEISMTYGISLEIDMNQTKCPECGGDLRAASGKEEVATRVPKQSFQLYNDFWVCNCTQCGKVYWKGSHWRQILNTLEKAKLLSSTIKAN